MDRLDNGAPLCRSGNLNIDQRLLDNIWKMATDCPVPVPINAKAPVKWSSACNVSPAVLTANALAEELQHTPGLWAP